jgi:AraC-like DNA-binding protein
MHEFRKAGGLQITSGVVDGPLGRWTHSECRAPHLAKYLEFIWLFDGTLTFRRERTFPNGLLEIIVHLDETRYGDVGADGVRICPRTCLAGMQVAPLVVEAPPSRAAVLGIRLTPAGAYVLIGQAMADVTGYTVDLADLCGASAAELTERCQGAVGAEARLRAAVRWLESRLATAAQMQPAVWWTVSQIRRHAGGVSIGDLRDATGMSRTRFVEAFRMQVGLTPKHYARIIRFRTLLDRLATRPMPLVEAAHDAGYYDQPHMNAEFKELSGFTPSEFLAAHRYPNTVSVAE